MARVMAWGSIWEQKKPPPTPVATVEVMRYSLVAVDSAGPFFVIRGIVEGVV